MTRDNFEDAVKELMAVQPFKPFIVELHGGERFQVDRRGALAWGDGATVFLGPGRILRIFDNESVVQIINAPAHAVRSRRPK